MMSIASSPSVSNFNRLSGAIAASPAMSNLNRLSEALAASRAVSDFNRLSGAIAASPAMSNLNRLSEALAASRAVSDVNRLSGAIAASPAMSNLNRLSGALAASRAVSDFNRLSGAIAASPAMSNLNRLSEALAASRAISDFNRLSGAIAASPAMSNLNRLSETLAASAAIHAVDAERAQRAIVAAVESRVAEMERRRQQIIAAQEARATEMERRRRPPSSAPVIPQLEDSLRTRQNTLGVASYSGEEAQAPREDLTNTNRKGAVSAHRNSGPMPLSPSSYDHLKLKLEFDLRLEMAPVPKPIESSVPYASPDPRHWMVLCELERRLRILVRDHLINLSGSKWVRQRVPQDVREHWYNRQDEDRADGRPVCELIEYANFMDLLKIVARSDNWRDVFQSIFRNKDEITVSFRRLNSIRKALAHGRPLSQMDVLILTAETSWIFGKLRIRALH